MKKEQLKALIVQFRDGTISDKDLSLLKQYIRQEKSDTMLMEIVEEFGSSIEQPEVEAAQSERLLQNILANQELQSAASQFKGSSPSYRLLRWVPIAAAGLLVLSLLNHYIIKIPIQKGVLDPQTVSTQISPGGSRANVVLDDGKIIDLEVLGNDTTIVLDGYAIRKDAEGTLSYEVGNTLDKAKLVYNTIVTPKNGEYHLVLPDGTKVWVNSGSELRYPLNFNTDARDVNLKGEAYFEVSKIKSRIGSVPFIVHSGPQRLEVLGTIFNVRSERGNIKTTLVEGSVGLTYEDGQKVMLKPNQQAVYQQSKKDITISTIDPFYATAWKNGSFAFDNISIYDVMDILADWYDVEIEYSRDVAGIYFTGTVSKYQDIDKVLQAIEMTGSIKFKMQGRRIVVMKV